MALMQLDDLLAAPRPKAKNTIEVTPSALAKIKSMIETKPECAGKGLRMYVTAGGCAGNSYGMAFDEPDKDDVLIDADGLQVMVDNESWPWLKGVRVDFVESLMGSGFSITNPNAQSTCGCGTSFSKGDGSDAADTESCH